MSAMLLDKNGRYAPNTSGIIVLVMICGVEFAISAFQFNRAKTLSFIRESIVFWENKPICTFIIINSYIQKILEIMKNTSVSVVSVIPSNSFTKSNYADNEIL